MFCPFIAVSCLLIQLYQLLGFNSLVFQSYIKHNIKFGNDVAAAAAAAAADDDDDDDGDDDDGDAEDHQENMSA